MHELSQDFGGQRCSVLVGSDLLGECAARCASLRGGAAPTSVVLVCDGVVAAHVEGRLCAALGAAMPGVRTHVLKVEASEHRKSSDEWTRLQRAAVAAGVDRGALVIAAGGGVVTDLGGFVAATLLRGVAWVALPTTLLAMVDAALGGKTGINVQLDQGQLAKNMCGAFWPPRLVACDVSLLSTLPAREVRAGLAECLKHAMLSDASLADLLAQAPADAHDAGAAAQRRLADLVARSARVKLAIVEQDPREEGPRMLLNLGHTFAHAFEAVMADDLLHGEAVAIGLVAAAEASVAAGFMSPADASAVRAKVEGLGLPSRLPMAVAVDTLVKAAGRDKKRVGGGWTLVLPRAGGGAEVVRGADERLLRTGLAAVGAE